MLRNICACARNRTLSRNEGYMEEEKKLPEAFCRRMERLLGPEYEEFLASYHEKRSYGLRWNPLKASLEEFTDRVPYLSGQISWAKEGFYYQESDQPGKDVLHEAGAYYIQEPSAMAVVEILDPKPGERILDLCAAPGGKSTQIAGRMNGVGLLVANEMVPGRAKILSQNVERMGIRNCVICSESPDRMAQAFPCFFDRIVVDAPCSGEGMFRKDETAVGEWSEAHVKMCADRQQIILEEAARMLKPGGVLVYSTCTFAPDENEGVVSRFLHRHEDFVIESIPHDTVFMPGRDDWIEKPVEGLEYTMRLWPHRLRGEGHYIARLRREEAAEASVTSAACFPDRHVKKDRIRKAGKNAGRENMDHAIVQDFLTRELGLASDWLTDRQGTIQQFGEQIYLVPAAMIPMQGMKVIRPGLHLGTDKKNRLEPSHSLALALKADETDRNMELSKEEAVRYLHGESLLCGPQRGWVLLSFQGYTLGFGKAVNGQVKNHYPKGLRK